MGQRRRILAAVLVVLAAVPGALPVLAAGKNAERAGERAGGVALRASFSSAIAKTSPAVVNIFTAKVIKDRVPVDDPRVDKIVIGSLRERVQKSLGSGVIVRDDGLLVTNLHVIEGASAIQVTLADGREFGARMVGSDDKLDLAVLRLDAPAGTHLPVARFGDSDSLDVGDVVLVLGNPYGIGQSASMGIVSAVARTNSSLSPYGQFIQTDASINPGDSGGALIDSNGALVGINTAIFTRSGGSQGIGFAIPASLVKVVVSDIASTGRVVRPWLGAEGQAMTPSVARELGLDSANGVLVTAIVEKSPAAAAGLKPGDVIVRLAGKDVTDPASLNDRILATPNLLNRPVGMVIWREGRMTEITVTMGALPPRATGERLVVKGYNPLNGVTVEPLTPALNVELGLALSTRGVAVVNVPVKSPLVAFSPLVQPGDLILSINGNPVRAPRDVQQAVDADRRSWELRIQRGGKVSKVMVK